MQSLWMLVASLCFALMGALVKVASAEYSAAQIVFFRGLFGVLAIGGFALASGRTLATPVPRMHLTRGLVGFSALVLWYQAIASLPLATATTLNYTSPLFIALFTFAVLREREDWRLGAAILAGFAGVALVLRPTVAAESLADGLFGLASGALSAAAYLQVRHLARLGEPEWRIVFFFSLTMSVATGLWMLVAGAQPLTPGGAAILFGVGLLATLAQLALTRAYARGRTLAASSLAYATVAFAAVIGWIAWDDTLGFGAWIGIALVVASGVAATVVSAAPARGGGAP
ncbi:MAG: DMT family transporter [Burkholderiales bacterium]|nr:DMT family transporter [Burkholderiales bacterium]